ncbi:MAG: DUF2071 domain-containing protein [Acidobacteriaceae bacterium]|nr:DUF2071 domain-containing protein [Acidobacteriaceae bacterium]MBV9781064.1 DUF2071 domain-containing protein [Acidobacteriaceae bacterium]
MFQSWRSLTFIHWRYRPDAIQRVLPKQLELDIFDGSAWVGLTPFLLKDLRPPFLPALPWLSQFPEMNVRTYVRGPDGEPGIWFFTLECARLAAAIGARLTYRLPYRWAKMRVSRGPASIEYTSVRRRSFGSGSASIAVEIGEPVRAGELERFLTARFRLYTCAGKHVAFAQIEHAPWPLRTARAIRLEQNVIQFSGVPPPSGEPLAHYSPGVNVLVERLRRAK